MTDEGVQSIVADIIPGQRCREIGSGFDVRALWGVRRLNMQGARAVLAKLAVPAIAIARHPGIEMLRGKMNPGDEKKPGHQLPTRQCEPYARPSVDSGVNAPSRIDGLHQAHRFVEI